MSAFVVTNIRLPEEDLKELKYKAIEERKSVNQLVRGAIEMYLSKQNQPELPEKDEFEKVIGSARSVIKDGSIKHDQ
ncbi:MAG: ribbon-helix-helix domain-containing protein [Nitrospinota bacterium]|nr:ribbon-helix-helix domain-containing protein [Nitrospinota bacterium]|tara:strand:- start:7 stop:237 length:231 start_codon:yes stop_codon:yes gene_type:complete